MTINDDIKNEINSVHIEFRNSRLSLVHINIAHTKEI